MGTPEPMKMYDPADAVGDLRGILTRIAYESSDKHAIDLARLALRCFDCDGRYYRGRMRDAKP